MTGFAYSFQPMLERAGRVAARAATTAMVLAAAVLLAGQPFLAAQAWAQDGSAQDAAIEMELNKLEVNETDCTSLFVVRNKTDTEFAKILTELVIFNKDRIVTKRLALDIAPLAAQKTRVLAMRISDVPCEAIDEILLNTVSDCQSGAAQIDDCVSAITVSSRAAASLTK